MNATAYRPLDLKPARIDVTRGAIPVVTRWGHVDDLVLRPGDRLLPGTGAGDLLLLGPRGRGRPMLAVRHRGRLLALPGRVPASEARWQVLGTVGVVERQLERGAPALGSQWVCFAFHPRTAVADVDAARRAFRAGHHAGAELHGLCLRATLAGGRYGVDVGIAVAATRARAEALLEGLEGGLLRFPVMDEPTGTVIVGPWHDSKGSSARIAGRSARQGRPASGGTLTVLPATAGGPRRTAGSEALDRQVLLPFAADSAGS